MAVRLYKLSGEDRHIFTTSELLELLIEVSERYYRFGKMIATKTGGDPDDRSSPARLQLDAIYDYIGQKLGYDLSMAFIESYIANSQSVTKA